MCAISGRVACEIASAPLWCETGRKCNSGERKQAKLQSSALFLYPAVDFSWVVCARWSPVLCSPVGLTKHTFSLVRKRGWAAIAFREREFRNKSSRRRENADKKSYIFIWIQTTWIACFDAQWMKNERFVRIAWIYVSTNFRLEHVKTIETVIDTNGARSLVYRGKSLSTNDKKIQDTNEKNEKKTSEKRNYETFARKIVFIYVAKSSSNCTQTFHYKGSKVLLKCTKEKSFHRILISVQSTHPPSLRIPFRPNGFMSNESEAGCPRITRFCNKITSQQLGVCVRKSGKSMRPNRRFGPHSTCSSLVQASDTRFIGFIKNKIHNKTWNKKSFSSFLLEQP